MRWCPQPARAVTALLIAAAMVPAFAGAAAMNPIDVGEPPAALPAGEAAAVLAAELGREVEALQRGGVRARGAGAVEALIAFRMVARELLVRGDSESEPSHAVVVAGFRLADARSAFDAAVADALERRPGGDDGSRPARARAALERFSEEALPSLRAAPNSELLPVAKRVVALLAPVLEAAGLPPLTDHWPILPRASTGAPAGGAAPPPPSVPAAPASPDSPGAAPMHAAAEALEPWGSKLARAAEEPHLPPGLAAELRSIAAKLAEAERWPDLEPEVALIAAPLLRLPADERTLAAVPWLDPATRDRLGARAIDALRRAADASTRSAALADLREREAAVRVIAVIAALDGAVPARESRTARDALSRERLWQAVEPLVLADDGADTALRRRAAERLGAIADLLETSRELRARAGIEPRQEFRTLHRRLLRDAPKHDETVARQVEALAGPGGTPADPAYLSLLAAQRARLRTLCAVAAVDAALAGLEAKSLSPGAPLVARLRTTLTSLGDPEKGDAALAHAEAFARQWRLLGDHPAERAIRADDPFVIDRCAGRAMEMLAELDRRRAAWAAAWAAGTPDAAWASAQELISVLELIEDAASLERTRADPRLIGRWGGWDDLAGVPGATDAMDGRIAIVVEALAQKDAPALASGLRVISREAPLWRLRAALLRRLAPALEPLPVGLAGALGRAVVAPQREAFMAASSAELAALGRASREFLHAVQRRDTARADALEASIRDMAQRLLAELEGQALDAPGDERPPTP